MFSILALCFGAWSRIAAFVNWTFCLLFLGNLKLFEYHHDYMMMGISTLFLLAPVENCWSFDAYRRRGKELPKAPVIQLHYDIFIFFGLALIYFDAVFFKLASPMWREGLGFAVTDHPVFMDMHFQKYDKVFAL